ncbi:hypothetical protein [Amycolatopsis magusensis]|uniref:5-methylcytosine-specific restriction enzyme subunit McrC n=1 Tax=Amycolatopsis magusensis TaxID=882444 RepID=A0ABS4PJ36_9PSEU|nr:hypothetical protein [Amycolatopsis magusensis]MBP2179433.1 hypothetical protein [Amycolatopsis magusensis]
MTDGESRKEESQRLSLPWEGVQELFRYWSGKGDLFAGLAAIVDDKGRPWEEIDVRRRAHRVLFQKCLPMIVKLPTRSDKWLAELPVSSAPRRYRGSAPSSGTDWVATRRHGWPPRTFEGRTRTRRSDPIAASVFNWVAHRLPIVQRDALQVDKELAKGVLPQLAALQKARAELGVGSTGLVTPDRVTLSALGRSGVVWREMSRLAGLLRLEDSKDLLKLSKEQIAPDDELRHRLFHLGALGLMLGTTRRLGWRVLSLRPLSGAHRRGPAFELVDPGGGTWELWFEAGALWRLAGVREPYLAATAGVAGRANVKEADLLLIERKRRFAVVVECKLSSDSSYIRAGYSQVVSYLSEIRAHFADTGCAFVLGPQELIPSATTGVTHSGSVTFCSSASFPSDLEAVLRGVV